MLVKWNRHPSYDVRRSPWSGDSRLSRIFDDAFWFSPFERLEADTTIASWSPAVDVIEDKDGYRIVVDLPGVGKEDVNVSLEDGVLIIRGEKHREREEENDRVHRFERVTGSFERTFTIPKSVSAERVSASFENGVLTVEVPKTKDTRLTQIPIKAS